MLNSLKTGVFEGFDSYIVSLGESASNRLPVIGPQKEENLKEKTLILFIV